MNKKFVWLGLSFLLVVALVLASCGGAVPGEQEEEEKKEEEGFRRPPKEAAELVILSMGGTYRSEANTVAITVSEVIFVDSYEYQDYKTGEVLTAEASPDMTYLILTAEIEFVGESGRNSMEGRVRFRVYDSEGNRYRFEYYLDTEEALGTIMNFYPGDKMDGRVLFEIPKEATGLVISAWSLGVAAKKLAEWPVE